ncbi:cyclin-dependent kinase inhibitor 1B-like [Daphnia carinata]|uniref:cyclin-dependent kinase inhibitor 1B-like n=1 Tax=Daphnia carinata TaxID=120202 RepID=UPI00257F2C97|nr:cyclin-dependent kinase inhibitor 1B-like [Daphnia carinata]
MPIVQMPYGFHAAVGGHSASSHMAVRGQVSPVRRRLFVSDGEEDSQDLDNRLTVERQLADIQREQTRQWNFDFANGVPLRGRYVWQPTTMTLPDRPSHPLPPPAGIKRPIDNQVDSAAPLYKQMKTDSHNVYDSINNNHRSVNQTKITDFMKNQKLNDSKRRDAGSLPSSSNELSH